MGASSGVRAVSPVVGVVLVVVLTVVLAGTVSVIVSGLSVQETSPQAELAVTVDTADDQVELEHLGGDTLVSDRPRLVWEIRGQQRVSEPLDAEQSWSAGETMTTTFDGVTDSTGAWTGHESPGVIDIQSGDQVRVTLYDTVTGRPVAEASVTASRGGAVAAPAYGDDLVWLHDDTAGATGVETEIRFEIQPGSPTVGNSLNSVEIDVAGSPDMFSGTDQDDVVTAGVDTDGDGETETDLEADVDDWTVSDGGSTLKVGFSGSAYMNPAAGETVVLVVEDTDAPASAGSYDVEVQTSGDGNWQSGAVVVS